MKKSGIPLFMDSVQIKIFRLNYVSFLTKFLEKNWKNLICCTILAIGLESMILPINSHTDLTPLNTVILSNQTDGEFCADFSIFLKGFSIDWIYMKTAIIPEEVKERNIIILGGPEALYTGKIVRELLTDEETALIHENTYYLFEKKNPWASNRLIYICAGSDRIFTKVALEETIKKIIEKSENPEEWIPDPFSDWSLKEALKQIAQYQFIPEDEYLLPSELEYDFNPNTYEYTPNVSSEEAKKDVERLFYLLSRGYCGYGYFKTEGDFDQAKAAILQELETDSTWTLLDFSELIYEHLQFIGDGHFSIGPNNYYHHKDFWYSRSFDIWKTEGEYYFISDDKRWKIIHINNGDPDTFIYPSLNAEGEPVYILGLLSSSRPHPLDLTAEDETGSRNTFQMRLFQSSPSSEEFTGIFREKEISGVPVVCIRDFRDEFRSELEAFLSTAEKYRGEPYLILDIRENGGGNSEWARKWVEKFTGYNPGAYLTSQQLISRTTLMGKINLFGQYIRESQYSKEYEEYLRECEEELRIFEESHSSPYWSDLSTVEEFATYSSDIRLISNRTRLIVLTSSNIWSSGELFIGLLRQVDNVIFVGENSAGAHTFGWVTLHQLPHSKFRVFCGCTLYFPIDLTCIEERGFSPDLWVPAGDALDCVLEAIEKGIL